MATTNHTVNYELSQYIGTDITSYLANYNSDMYKIDAQMKTNADDAATAMSDAASAVTASEAAVESAGTALTTAQSANTAAEAAQTAASGAQTAAGAAQTAAEEALTASVSNSITNLAPAYDPTLTYDVGDICTYVDAETNHGGLYKCIIPISTPHAFNINEWDDVTTSEIYSRKALVENTVTADGVKTYNQLLSEIKPDSVDTTVRYTIVISTSTFDMVFTSTLLRSDLIAFASTRIGGSGITIETVAISLISDCEYKSALITTTPTVTITDQSSNAPVAGVVITLYGEKMN